MKKLFLFALLLMLPLGMQAADQVPTLVVLTKDNATHEFQLPDKPQVTFEGTSLVVKSDRVTSSFAIGDVVRFTYVMRDASGIDDLQADGTEPGVNLSDDGTLTLSQLPEGAVVGVYSIDGILRQQLKATHAGTYRLSLSQLPFGVYIVKTGTLTYKITKR